MKPQASTLVRPSAFAPLFLCLISIPAAAAPAPPCRPVPGAEELLRPGKVLLLGEQHGTAQSPAFVLDLACRAVEAGVPLKVGIELPESDRQRVDTFLASTGDAAARRVLLGGPSWQADYQDGRNSEAMVGLIDGLRRLRREGRGPEVVLFDQPGSGGSQARDRRMAAWLTGVVENSEESLLVVLTGNIHSRVAGGTRWNPDYESMGFLLSKAVDPERIVALDVAHRGGTAWLCVGGGGCGPQKLAPRGPDGTGITLDASPGSTGHHGWYHVGEITASPPARDRAGDENVDRAAAAESGSEILWQFETGG